MKQKLKIGFSTCPNDTFIFDAIVNNKIDTGNFDFEVVLADVEELNKMATDRLLDITKLSFHAYAHLSDKYQILNTGSALGFNNGPLLVAKQKIYPDEINDISIAIPGINTTANLLLSIAYPEAQNRKEYLFSEIEDAVLYNEVDAGLIIHESRFTYKNKGLKKIIDLGEYWQDKYDMPVPLGCIVINRNIENNIKKSFDKLLKDSISFAMQNPSSSQEYIKRYAWSVKDDVIAKHIQLYVNNYTMDLGTKGKTAITGLFKEAADMGLITNVVQDRIFVD